MTMPGTTDTAPGTTTATSSPGAAMLVDTASKEPKNSRPASAAASPAPTGSAASTPIVAAPAPKVNAWAKKPNIKPVAAAAATTNVPATATSTSAAAAAAATKPQQQPQPSTQRQSNRSSNNVSRDGQADNGGNGQNRGPRKNSSPNNQRRSSAQSRNSQSGATPTAAPSAATAQVPAPAVNAQTSSTSQPASGMRLQFGTATPEVLAAGAAAADAKAPISYASITSKLTKKTSPNDTSANQENIPQFIDPDAPSTSRLSFGTVDTLKGPAPVAAAPAQPTPAPRGPVPVQAISAVRPHMMQQFDIQRTRSAPPQLFEQPASPQAPIPPPAAAAATAVAPATPTPAPNPPNSFGGFNPGANAFNPASMMPAGRPHPHMQYGMPPQMMNRSPQQPMPYQQQPYPVYSGNQSYAVPMPSSVMGAAPFRPMGMTPHNMFTMPPGPSSRPDSSSSSSTFTAPIVPLGPPVRKVLVFKKPDTNETVDFAELKKNESPQKAVTVPQTASPAKAAENVDVPKDSAKQDSPVKQSATEPAGRRRSASPSKGKTPSVPAVSVAVPAPTSDARSRSPSPNKGKTAEIPAVDAAATQAPISRSRSPSPNKGKGPAVESPEKGVKTVERTEPPSPKKQSKREPSPAKSPVVKTTDIPTAGTAPATVVAEPEPELEEGELKESPVAATTDEPRKKRIYSRQFLIELKDLCKEPPKDLPKNVTALIGEDNYAGSRGGGGSSSRGGPRRGAADRYQERSRMSDADTPRDRDPRSGGASSRGGPVRGGAITRLPPGLQPPAPSSRYGSGGGSSSRRSSARDAGPVRGGRSSAPPEPVYEPLQHSENRWVPSAVKKVVDVDAGVALVKKARGLLNKLTLERFDSITRQFLELGVEDKELMKQLVITVFEKAVDEPKFAEIYARLCYKIGTEIPDFSDEYMQQWAEEDGAKEVCQSKVLFRRCLLNVCQQEFFKKSEWASLADLEGKNIDDMTPEEVAELAAAKSLRSKLKRRALGTIRFIGELFKLQVLSEKIMHGCVERMLLSEEEEEIESLCDLFTTVGQKMDHAKAVGHMNAYFAQLRILSDKEGLSSRIKFKILDVIDLRGRRWVERELKQQLDAGPMTLEEVRLHDEAVRRTEARKLNEGSRFSGRDDRRGSRHSHDDRRRESRGSGDGWNAVGRSSGASSRRPRDMPAEPSRLGQLSRPAEDPRSVVLGPAGSSSSAEGARGWSATKGGSRTSASGGGSGRAPAPAAEEKKATTSNPFAALDEPAGDDSAADVDDAESVESVSSAGELQKAVKSSGDLEKYFGSEFCNDFTVAIEDTYAAGIDVLLKLRSFVEEGEEEKITVRALEKLIETYSSETLKQTEVAHMRVDGLANCIVCLVTDDIMTKESVQEMLDNQIFNLADLIIDVPGMDACVGYIVGVCIDAELFDLARVKSAVLRLVEEYGDFSPMPVMRGPPRDPTPPPVAKMFAAIFKAIKSGSGGDDAVTRVWKEYTATLTADDQPEGLDQPLLLIPWWGTNKERLQAVKPDVLTKWLDEHDLGALLEVTE